MNNFRWSADYSNEIIVVIAIADVRHRYLRPSKPIPTCFAEIRP